MVPNTPKLIQTSEKPLKQMQNATSPHFPQALGSSQTAHELPLPTSELHLSLILPSKCTCQPQSSSLDNMLLPPHTPLLRMSSHFWFTRITPQSMQKLSPLFVNLSPNLLLCVSFSFMLPQYPIHTLPLYQNCHFCIFLPHLTVSFLKGGTMSHLSNSRAFYIEALITLAEWMYCKGLCQEYILNDP